MEAIAADHNGPIKHALHVRIIRQSAERRQVPSKSNEEVRAVTTEEARAVAEVAKTTGEIVKAAGGVGSYLAKIIGSIPENLLGLIGGDWLEHKRRRNLARLGANTARMLAEVDQERLTEPSPSVLIPLLEASVDEEREELQAMWAALLANAMVDGGGGFGGISSVSSGKWNLRTSYSWESFTGSPRSPGGIGTLFAERVHSTACRKGI